MALFSVFFTIFGLFLKISDSNTHASAGFSRINKKRRPSSGASCDSFRQSGLEASSADNIHAGPSRGHAASGGSTGLGVGSLALEVGIGRLLGATVHRHDLALRGSQAGHGAAVSGSRVAVRALPHTIILVEIGL